MYLKTNWLGLVKASSQVFPGFWLQYVKTDTSDQKVGPRKAVNEASVSWLTY